MKIKKCLATLMGGNYPALILMFLGVFVCSASGSGRFGFVFIMMGGLIFFRKNPINLKQMFREFYPIRWWIFASFGLFVMACVSLLFCFDIVQTSVAIVKFLILPTFLTCMFYLIFRHLNENEARFSLIVLGGIFFLHSIATIAVYLWSGNPRSVGLGNQSIIPYVIFLLLSFSIALAILIYTRYKLLSIVLIVISLFALYANGTRASILSVGAMVVCAVLYPKYRYKKWIVSLSFLVMFGGGVALLEWSEEQNARFNFRAMIDRIGVVWSYAPAEMGRFDELCFPPNPSYRCSPYSGDKLDPRFSFDSSALQRISLNKSALLQFLDNPWRPNGFYSRNWKFNVSSNFSQISLPYLRDEQNRSYHEHIHNEILSSFVEMGILGGAFYIASFVVLFLWAFMERTMWGGLLFFSLTGLIVMACLDTMMGYVSLKACLYCVIGILLGRIFTQERKNENRI